MCSCVCLLHVSQKKIRNIFIKKKVNVVYAKRITIYFKPFNMQQICTNVIALRCTYVYNNKLASMGS